MEVPSSPGGGGQPLQPVSHNAQRESVLFSTGQQQRDRLNFGESASTRDSTVHEKINQFNTLAMQHKQHQRKTDDAALKRAVLGREEAEAEMRRYRDEARSLRKQVEEGKARERKVGERLEARTEQLVRHKEQLAHDKEQYAHNKEEWQKAIRHQRKEVLKLQSSLNHVQTELMSCRTAQKAAEDELQAERERRKAREQEVSDAQNKLVGLQEQLDQALGRVTMLEQELDAIKTLAKNEAEARRLADEDADEWAGPRKRARLSSTGFSDGNPEVETLTMLWEWEKQRADRALEQVDFLEAECQLKLCGAAKALRQSSLHRRSSPRKRTSMLISDAGDSMILSESRRASAEGSKPTPRQSKTDRLRVDKEPRRSTIFLAAEGIFRTVSQAEADAMAARSASPGVSPTETAPSFPITPTDSDPMYRRTPSVDPPDFAVLSKERTSLLSLLDAPHRQDPTPVFNIPTTPGPAPEARQPSLDDADDAPATIKATHFVAHEEAQDSASSFATRYTDPLPSQPLTTSTNNNTMPPPPPRPHTTASHYPTTATTKTTTTKVPLREEPTDGPTLAQRLLKMQQRTPSRQTGHNNSGEDDLDLEKPSFDTTNPALTPTMTREQALAQIRERRGRARSVGRVGSGGNTTATGGAAGAGGASGTAGGSASASGRRSAASGRGSAASNASGSGTGNGEVRRKVSGNGTGAGEVRRKVSHGELAAGRRVGGGQEDRGRDREVRREVSAPTGGTVRGAVAGVRRVRS